MTRIQKSALVPYTAREMYDLVNDSARYPEFLPWCTGARVLKDEVGARTASLDLSKSGVSKSFTTVNHLYPGERIEMRLLEGPFKELAGVWRFAALSQDGREAGCKVELDLSFEFSSKLVALAFGSVFSQIASSLVDAFQKRAVQVHGRR